MIQLQEHNGLKVGDKFETDYKGEKVVSEVKEIIKYPSGHIMIREHLQGDPKAIKAFQQEQIDKGNDLQPVTLKKPWWQVWRRVKE